MLLKGKTLRLLSTTRLLREEAEKYLYCNTIKKHFNKRA